MSITALQKKVIIITLSYNQNDYTLKCIESILDSNYDNFEVLLIDNGSTKENFESLKQKLPNDKRILLHRIERNKEYVGGVNYGLEKGIELKPDYFLIMNNDTVIDPLAVSSMVGSCKRNNDKVIVTGKVYFYDAPNVFQILGFRFIDPNYQSWYKIGRNEIDNGQYDAEEERDMIDDVFWLFPAELYHLIGNYPEYYGFGHEQADWASKAKKIGYKLMFTPEAKLWHKENATVGHKVLTPYKAFWGIEGRLIYKWLYVKKKFFIKIYLRIILEIISAFRYDFISIFNKKTPRRFAIIKTLAFLRFHIWIFFKFSRTRLIPKSLKT